MNSPIAGQWWSIRAIHFPHLRQWCVRSGLTTRHRVQTVGHWVVSLRKVIGLNLKNLHNETQSKLTMFGHSNCAVPPDLWVRGRKLPIDYAFVPSAWIEYARHRTHNCLRTKNLCWNWFRMRENLVDPVWSKDQKFVAGPNNPVESTVDVCTDICKVSLRTEAKAKTKTRNE